MVDCWKSNRFEYPELEEMFIINMAHHNNNPELLARELESTLRNSRFCKNVLLYNAHLSFVYILKRPVTMDLWIFHVIF